MVVPKPDKSVRLCGDYKVNVNRVISGEQYPLSKTDDMFATLAGGEKLTKLDLRQAYSQLELSSDSKEYLTVNTHLRLYRYRRLAYGVCLSSAIFQGVINKILSGLPYVVCRIDDILIITPDDDSHVKTIQEVFHRLREHKCIFMADQVIYMGFLWTNRGCILQMRKLLQHVMLQGCKACDSPAYDLGTVVSHIMDAGSERLIAFASRTLNSSERYQYQIQYRASQENGNCDSLSKLPISDNQAQEDYEEIYFSELDDIELPVSNTDIYKATKMDPGLSKVHKLTLTGWPNHNADPELQPFFERRISLSVEQRVVLLGIRVVIPKTLIKRILEELHEEHLGMCRSLARRYL
ncbi:uncharacterized protein K02A2.6-like [Saccostrea cucullata]|uniref:uncharacterized protein K02A2.6-like n=1 Tax=Saccostrea cuccullata TaxID=36930 RepID=UPI002ED346F3